MSETKAIHMEDTIQKIYRESITNVVCPEEMQKRIVQKMEHAAGKEISRLRTRFKLPVAVVMTCLLFVVILLSDTKIVGAFERIITRGIGYFVEDINGVEDVSVLKYNFLWEQEVENKNHNLSDWEEYYPEFYKELETNQLLDVFLPHYGMGQYAWEDTVDYVGGPLHEGEASAGAKFVNEDSSYYMDIHKRQDDVSFLFVHKLSKRYQLEVNGIVYEILEISEDYTYDEYTKITEYVFKERSFGKEDEAWFEEFMKRPIYAKANVNGVYYSYSLSRDIDLQEFLDSIY